MLSSASRVAAEYWKRQIKCQPEQQVLRRLRDVHHSKTHRPRNLHRHLVGLAKTPAILDFMRHALPHHEVGCTLYGIAVVGHSPRTPSESVLLCSVI